MMMGMGFRAKHSLETIFSSNSRKKAQKSQKKKKGVSRKDAKPQRKKDKGREK